MHPDGWSCPGSSMRTIIRMMCCAAACSRSFRWKSGFSTPCPWEATEDEVRARTLVGALESLRCGITTVQDMLGLSPLTDEQTDVVIAAYREAGIRVVFSPMVWDIPPIAMVRHKDSLPPTVQEMLGNKPRSIREQLDYLEHQFKRHPASGTLHWAIAPFAPQRCTPK